MYSGLRFKIAIHFPPNYPMAPPAIKFESPCFHPNVDITSGAICLDILQDKWSAVYSVQTILLSLQSLLGGTSPLSLRLIPCVVLIHYALRTEQRLPAKPRRLRDLGQSGWCAHLATLSLT